MMREDIIVDNYWTLFEEINEAERKEGDPKDGNKESSETGTGS